MERGGLRIGIMAVNVNPEGLVMQANYRGMQWLDPVGVANETADYLKGRLGCDLVICLSHLGADEAKVDGSARRKEQLIRALGPDSTEQQRITYVMLTGLGSHTLSAVRELVGLPVEIESVSVQGEHVIIVFRYNDFLAVYEILNDQDVVRHVMVQRIIKAYDDYYSRKKDKR